MKEKKDIKYRVLRGLLKAWAHLPLRVMYGVSDIGAFVLYRLLHYRIKVVRSNLRLAFPEKSPEELRHIEKEFYRHLCDVFVEAAKLAHISLYLI
ncbi:MAG: hypothetical protein K2F87_01745, partial [Muribaculaceae bacterium]|nr:hypothetical protein [Muribaculaceae bacterium]